MKPPFAFEARSRLALWALREVKAFSALVAPWLARPQDRPMSRLVLLAIVLLLALGLAAAGIGTVEGVHMLTTWARRDEGP